jgi:hypothetical protein
MDMNQVIKTFRAFRKAVNQPVKSMTYSGKAGWFDVDGAKTRLPGLVAEVQKYAKKMPEAAAFLTAANGNGQTATKPASKAPSKPATAATGEKRGPGRPRKDGSPAQPSVQPSKVKTLTGKGARVKLNGQNGAKPASQGKAQNKGGRPAMNQDGPMEKITLSMSADHKAILENMGGGNASAGLRILVGHFQAVQNQIAQQAMAELAGQQG